MAMPTTVAQLTSPVSSYRQVTSNSVANSVVNSVVMPASRQVTSASGVIPAERQITTSSVVVPAGRQVTSGSVNMQPLTTGVTVNAIPIAPTPIPQGISSAPAGVTVVSPLAMAPAVLTPAAAPAIVTPAVAPTMVTQAALPQAVGAAVMMGPVPPPLTMIPPVPSAPAVVEASSMPLMPPVPPAKLTDGMPNPREVAEQKQEFARHIMVQQKENEAILQQQADHEKEHARLAADRYKALVLGRLEVQMREEEMAAEHEYHNQLANLREAACRKRAALEKQAGDLVMEYSARKAQDDMNKRNHQMQFHQWEAGRQDKALLEPPRSETLMQQLAAKPDQMSRRVDARLPELPVHGWVPDGI